MTDTSAEASTAAPYTNGAESRSAQRMLEESGDPPTISTPGRGQRHNLIRLADAMERSLGHTEESMIRTSNLIAIVEQHAADLFQLAAEWEEIDQERARRWRTKEIQVRALSESFAGLEEVETRQAKAIIASLRELASAQSTPDFGSGSPTPLVARYLTHLMSTLLDLASAQVPRS